MPKSCDCVRRISTLRAVGGSTNSGCHGNTAGVSAHQKHIISGPQLVLILWDDYFFNTAGSVTQATQLATDLVSGSFMNGLVQYGVDRGAIAATVTISNTANPPNKRSWDASGTDDGDQLAAWLTNGTIATVPAVNETRLLYLVYLPTTLGLTAGTKPDGTPNVNVCGWHGHRKFNSASTADDLFWCVLRTDNANTSSPYNFVNSTAYCASHEIAEAVTNRDTYGWHGDDSYGCEIGDLCEANASGPVVTFKYRGWDVEKYWSQWDNACINGDQAVSMRAFLSAIGFDTTKPLSQLGTPVINLSYMASKLA